MAPKSMAVSNQEIAKLFENMGALLEIKGDTIFKIRAYQRVARTITDLSFPISTAIDDEICLLYTSPSPRDATQSRMQSSA